MSGQKAMAAPGLKLLGPTRLSPTKTRLNAGARCINYIGKILLFFAKCATLGFIGTGVGISEDNDIINKNFDFGRYIPGLRREVYKETVWEQDKLL